jgi:dephospho-CoA kinase
MSFKYAIVLTGGIATGKSTVVKFFTEEGFRVIDADKIAHMMLELHKNSIAELFGSEYIVENRVDRKSLGTLIFSNPKERLRLEKLLHPLIFSEIERRAKEEDAFEKPYIIDIPLFFESEGRYPIKESIVVYTPYEKQLERLMHRDGSTTEEAQKRIGSQLNIEEKRELSTYLINNSKNFKYLQEECVRVKNIILTNFLKE